ncbi:MAG: DMT family transporter [Desulfovibrio sp.]|nr:MAG: DMT family transporter [Desulfovibrio sp.]
MTAIHANLLLLLTALIWGCGFVAQRMGTDHVGPFTFNGVRFALGACVLIPVMLRVKMAPPAYLSKASAWKRYLLGGGLAGAALFAGATLQQIGIMTTTAGKAGFITGLYVVMVPLMGLAFKQRPGLGTWIGAVLAVAGMYLLSVTESFSLTPGDTFVLIGAVFWAVHVLVIGWLSPRMDPIRLAAAQFGACSVLSLIAAASTESITFSGLAGASGALLFSGLVSVGVAYTLQVVAQRQAKPAHAAIILSLEAAFAALAGWLFLNEILTMKEFLGCGLMLGGMLASQLRS